ncbi:VOC family protein [Devosia ginsengisoli]|uniref:VOC family protein n=1 Tax=Devosia ginsengisoli TaxID=400770 RepID=A0A5B8LXC5_9HYPH|nr:VOC family protein [Devosia ginsengisoli]QDZ13108.1 VOC family protein [Devosia ginsengisoli]
MADDQFILGGTGTEMFSGIPVSNFQTSLDWYQRLFGAKPSFFPNETEAVWAIAEHRWIYIIVDVERAGGAIQTIMSSDLEAVIEQISERGLSFGQEEIPAEGVRKVMYYDPDGNEIGLGRIPSE